MNISDLTLEERESHISQSAADRSKWLIYTDDPVMIARLDKMRASDDSIERTDKGVGFEYAVSKKHVSIRNPRKLSDEQKERLAAQLARGRQTQKRESVAV